MSNFISPNVTHINNGPMRKGYHRFMAAADIETVSTIHPNGVVVIDCNTMLVTEDVLESLFRKYDVAGHLYPVGRSGLKCEKDVGSERFCTMNKDFAEAFETVIRNSEAFPSIIDSSEGSYYFTGVSSYFRFMRYEPGGMHYPHYDSDFELPHNITTKYSMVAYFSNNNSGELAFIENDPDHCVSKSDWDRQATDDEITLKVPPRLGRIVLFPHHLCHTVLELGEDEYYRYVVRGDLEFISTEKTLSATPIFE